MRNAPRFPQGKAVANASIPSSHRYDMRPDSVEKLQWGTEQVRHALRLESGYSWEIKGTNFDANPQTMRHWINRACSAMFPSNNRHIAYKYRGTRRSGSLYIQVVFGKKPSVGKPSAKVAS